MTPAERLVAAGGIMIDMIGTTGRTMWGRIESAGRIDEHGEDGEDGENCGGAASWEVSDVSGR